MTSEERLTLTIPEAAGLLGIGQTLAYEMASAGLLPVLRLGRVIRIPKAALTRWIEKNTRYDEIDDRTSTQAGVPAPKPQGRTGALPPTRRPLVAHRRDASAGGQETAPVGLRRLAS